MSQLPLQNSLMNYMDNGFYQPDIMQELKPTFPLYAAVMRYTLSQLIRQKPMNISITFMAI